MKKIILYIYMVFMLFLVNMLISINTTYADDNNLCNHNIIVEVRDSKGTLIARGKPNEIQSKLDSSSMTAGDIWKIKAIVLDEGGNVIPTSSLKDKDGKLAIFNWDISDPYGRMEIPSTDREFFNVTYGSDSQKSEIIVEAIKANNQHYGFNFKPEIRYRTKDCAVTAGTCVENPLPDRVYKCGTSGNCSLSTTGSFIPCTDINAYSTFQIKYGYSELFDGGTYMGGGNSVSVEDQRYCKSGEPSDFSSGRHSCPCRGTDGITKNCSSEPSQYLQLNDGTKKPWLVTVNIKDYWDNVPYGSDYHSCKEINASGNICVHPVFQIDLVPPSGNTLSVKNPILATSSGISFDNVCVDQDNSNREELFDIQNNGVASNIGLYAKWGNESLIKNKISINKDGDYILGATNIMPSVVRSVPVKLNKTGLDEFMLGKELNTWHDYTTIQVKGYNKNNKEAIDSPKDVLVKVKLVQCDNPSVTCSVSPSSGYVNEQEFTWTANFQGVCPPGKSVRYFWKNVLDGETSSIVKKVFNSIGPKSSFVVADCGEGTKNPQSDDCSVNVIEKPKPSCSISGPGCVNENESFNLTHSTYNANSALINPGNITAEIGTNKTTSVNGINVSTTYTMNVDRDGEVGSCSKNIVLCSSIKRVFKGIFISKEVEFQNADRELVIEYDPSVVNQPPPGFADLLRPSWFELLP